jgi:hypothetical protein
LPEALIGLTKKTIIPMCTVVEDYQTDRRNGKVSGPHLVVTVIKYNDKTEITPEGLLVQHEQI